MDGYFLEEEPHPPAFEMTRIHGSATVRFLYLSYKLPETKVTFAYSLDFNGFTANRLES